MAQNPLNQDKDSNFTKDIAPELGTSPDVSVLEVMVVSRAVDDGDMYSSAPVLHEKQPNNVHRLSDAIHRTRDRVTHKLHDISGSVKSSASHMGHEVKVKAVEVTDGIKKGVDTVNTNVKANPYLYAAGAVGVGFLLGRIFLSYKDKKAAKAEADSSMRYYASRDVPNDHTGVHVREDRAYAGGSGI